MRSYIFDKKEKSVFDLLKNCISNDCTRKNLCHAYYDGNGNIYATDGRRLAKISSKRLIEKLGDKSPILIINRLNMKESFLQEMEKISFSQKQRL